MQRLEHGARFRHDSVLQVVGANEVGHLPALGIHLHAFLAGDDAAQGPVPLSRVAQIAFVVAFGRGHVFPHALEAAGFQPVLQARGRFMPAILQACLT